MSYGVSTLMGNTVPADITKYGTLAEGLYPADFGSRASYVAKGKEDLAILINKGGELPTVFGNPNKKNSDMLTAVFFHAGNNYQESLFDSKGNAYSKGCQTGGSYAGAKEKHNAFMRIAGLIFKETII